MLWVYSDISLQKSFGTDLPRSAQAKCLVEKLYRMSCLTKLTPNLTRSKFTMNTPPVQTRCQLGVVGTRAAVVITYFVTW